MNEIQRNYPQCYWNRDVSEEVCKNINVYFNRDKTKFVKAFINSTDHFFAGFNSYWNIINIYNELSDVSYDEELKTRIYRNPVYSQLCEDCLMNLYRFLRDIVNEFSPKDYSNQNTLGEVVPALQKNGFSISVQVDIDMRNAINHGNVFQNDSKIIFRYRKGTSYESKEISVWEYDDIVTQILDLCSGVVVGVLRFLCDNSFIINEILNSNDQEIKFDIFSLIFRSQSFHVKQISEGLLGSSQLTVMIETVILDKTAHLMTLIKILKGSYLMFKHYDRYAVSSKYSRSIGGWIRVNKSVIEKCIREGDDSEMFKSAMESMDYLIWPIETENVDERAYKFHMFPSVEGRDWVVINISDVSVEGCKRIRGQLLINYPIDKQAILSIIHEAVVKLKNLCTPRNPKYNVPYGTVEADAVFLNVHYRSQQRKKFSMFTSNNDFISVVHYYRTQDVPRLINGGTFEKVWKCLRIENYKEIEIVFNPSVVK